MKLRARVGELVPDRLKPVVALLELTLEPWRVSLENWLRMRGMS